MDKQHPITPPPELVQQWMEDFCCDSEVRITNADWYLVAKAAQWGADQELEACANWAEDAFMDGWGEHLRAARRPKPPSLKQQAIAELEQIPIDPEAGVLTSSLEIIRRALESIPDSK